MKIDTKHAPKILDRLCATEAGALASILDRALYDGFVEDKEDSLGGKCVKLPARVFVCKDGPCRWVAPCEGKDEYADTHAALVKIRDELYAMALGSA